MFMISLFLFMISILSGLLSKSPFNAVLFLISASIFLMLYIWVFCHKWLSLALALIFIGGMMVMFMYATSLANNEKIQSHMAPFTFYFLIFISVNLFSTFFNTNSWYNSPQTPSLFFLEYSVHLLSFLVFYLLIVLLMVVKIVESFKGALKPNKSF